MKSPPLSCPQAWTFLPFCWWSEGAGGRWLIWIAQQLISWKSCNWTLIEKKIIFCHIFKSLLCSQYFKGKTAGINWFFCLAKNSFESNVEPSSSWSTPGMQAKIGYFGHKALVGLSNQSISIERSQWEWCLNRGGGSPSYCKCYRILFSKLK